MEITISKKRIPIFNNCNLIFDVGTNLIFGFNNSGKTSLLAYIDLHCDEMLNKSAEYVHSILIPTNRIVRDYNGKSKNWDRIDDFAFKDLKKRTINQFVFGTNGMLNKSEIDYRGHLTNIRGQLFGNPFIKEKINRIIKQLFNINYKDGEIYSDGVENIINIYLNIIWLVCIKQGTDDIKIVGKDTLFDQFNNTKIVILIDEIEAYLHASVLSKFIKSIQNEFKSAILIYTTHSSLVLSRVDANRKYKISSGKIVSIDDDLYYQSVDKIYETNFDVPYWPEDVHIAMRYIEESVLNKNYDKRKLGKYLKVLDKYPNIKDDYSELIIYAKEQTTD